MLFHPLAPLLSLLVGVTSLLIFGYGGYWIWEYWDAVRDVEAGRRLLEISEREAMRSRMWWGVGMLAFTAFGRQLALLLLGRRGTDDPKPARSSESRIIERPDGAKLRVEFFGPENAPCIILTHGFANDSTTWYYLKKLSERFRLILWDLRGLGQSRGPGNGDYSLATMADDLSAVVSLAPVGQPLVLAGHSMGGMITLTLMKNADLVLRERIGGLALLNTTFTNPAKTCLLRSVTRTLQKPVLEPLLWLVNIIWPLVWLSNWSSYSNGTSHIMTRIFTFAGNQTRGQLDYCTWLSVCCSPKVLARQMLAMFRYDVTDALPQIDLPALVITAPKDKATEPDASEFLRSHLPQAKLVTIEGAAHASMDEQGAAVRDAVAEFVQSVAPRAASSSST